MVKGYFRRNHCSKEYVLRSKEFAKSTVASVINQIVIFLSGFILPKLILRFYGSDTNGLIHSISQFLTLISFLEMGMGAVVQSALYAPLAENDMAKVSEIVTDSSRFFKKIAGLLLLYVVLLAFVYPTFINNNFGAIYTASLIAALSIGNFVQYYFGITDTILLSAGQKLYLTYNINTIFLIVNIILNYILVYSGASIQTLKFVTGAVFLGKPFLLRMYVNRSYHVDRKARYNENPIPQKWNGVAQHIAHTVLNSTDYIILTVFSTLAEVSVYSVYALVLSGLRQVYIALTNSIMPLFGDMWARKEGDKLIHFFGWAEWLLHTFIVFLFGCTAVLLVPFVQVYTMGIHDANYYQPIFSIILTLAYGWYCLRVPYNSMILAAGHYRQTQASYLIAAGMNLLISSVAVLRFGLIGVAAGTFISMLYHTVWMAYYLSRNIIKWKFRDFMKQMAVDLLSVAVCMAATAFLKLKRVSYISWGVMAIETSIIWIVCMSIINLLFYRDKLLYMLSKLRSILKRMF